MDMCQLWEVRSASGSRFLYSFTEACRVAREAGEPATIYTEQGEAVASLPDEYRNSLTIARKAA